MVLASGTSCCLGFSARAAWRSPGAKLQDRQHDHEEGNQDHDLLSAVSTRPGQLGTSFSLYGILASQRHSVEEERNVVCRDRDEPQAESERPD